MIKIFKKVSRFLKSAFRYVYLNVKYIRKEYTISHRKAKYAILNFDHQIKSEDNSRYYYIICMFLKLAGYNIIIKANWRDFKSFRKPVDFKKPLLEQKYIFVKNSSTPPNSIILLQPNTPNHTIHISYGYHLAYVLSDIIQSGQVDCIAPYPVHPNQTKLYLDPGYLHAVREANRTMKIFFAGDTSETNYLSAKVQKFFDIIPRLEIIKFILLNFENSRKLQNEAGKQMLNKLMFTNDYINEIIISQVKTKEQDWLRILSKADFFICTPGARMPWSHNCVEAMSVGTIPILQYSNLFYPHLENNKNCLSFTNSDEIKVVIKKALAMERVEIEEMRKNVLNYYNEYLAVDRILKKINDFSGATQTELKVAFPFIATRKEWGAIQAEYSKEELELLGIFK